MDRCFALTFSIPTLEDFTRDGIWYYLVCGILFLITGLAVGYFIWRKGHMQTSDAEAEIRRTKGDLERLRGDLQSEEAQLGERTGPA